MIEKDLLRIGLLVLFTAFALKGRPGNKTSGASRSNTEKINGAQKVMTFRSNWVQRQQQRISSLFRG